MSSFKDTAGRTWELNINPASMKRVRSLCGVNLGTILSDGMKPLSDLLNDPIDLVDVLYCLCKTQANQLGVTDEEFGAALVGDVFQTAADGFLEALTDFSPSRQRRLLKTFLATVKKTQDQAMEEAEETLQQMPTSSASSLQPSAV